MILTCLALCKPLIPLVSHISALFFKQVPTRTLKDCFFFSLSLSPCTYHAETTQISKQPTYYGSVYHGSVKWPCKLCRCSTDSTNDAVRTNADRNTTFTFVPAPPGTIRATAAAHRSPPSERFSGLHIATYRPSDHAGSAIGLHDCIYRGAKTGNFKLREQLAVELNIWRRSAIYPTLSNIFRALQASHQIPLSHRSAMAYNNRFRPLWISRCSVVPRHLYWRPKSHTL